jgi:small subunit ribosomal protein S21
MSSRGRSVVVQDGNIERAIRKFKKKIAASGLLMDLRDREHYIKPTTRKKTAKSQAQRRWQKHLAAQELPKKLY